MTKQLTLDTETLMIDNFTEYGFATIEDRALPDIRDGLKPVHRSIIYEFQKAKATSKDATKKSARITGSIIGKWHPHGDIAVYDAMIKLGQPWNLSEPIVYVHGNNGSIYGDPAAAQRYTESRLSQYGDTFIEWLRPEVVPYVSNYDDTEIQPSILPMRLPNWLINGGFGIATGMLFSLPPHNTRDVIKTTMAYLKKPQATTEELLKHLNGPDFPTGGQVINKDDLLTLYETGLGTLRIRGKIVYDEKKHSLHVVEVPFTKSGNVESLVREITLASMETVSKSNKKVPPKIKGISQVEDHSGKNGIDICISLDKEVNHEQIKMELFAKTKLEDTLTYSAVSLNEKQVSIYSLKKYLNEYLAYQYELIDNKYCYDKSKIEKRLEILKGLLILQKIIDEVVACAKLSSSKDAFINTLMTGEKPKGLPKVYHATVKTFRFSQVQATYIADLPIHRISKTDALAIASEVKNLREELAIIDKVLSSQEAKKEVVLAYLKDKLKLFKTDRKTEMTNQAPAIASKMEVPESARYITVDQYNYVKLSDKPFDEAYETTNKSRVGVFDKEGVLWNIHLENQQVTKGMGQLLDTYVPVVDTPGFVLLPQDQEGLFVYENGNVKRVLMSRFMTKTKATKVTSGRSDLALVTYKTIPQNAKTVTINGVNIALTDIPLQGLSGSGTRLVEPSDTYNVTYSEEETPSKKSTKKTKDDAWCAFQKDGRLVFDWTMGEKLDGLYVTTYSDLLAQELVFVHNDGTAKRVKGSQFEVKTKRSDIQSDKAGTESIYIAPVTETLLATFDTNTQKRIDTSLISEQGKTGGGVRAFYHNKHRLLTVEDGSNSDLPLVSLATNPK